MHEYIVEQTQYFPNNKIVSTMEGGFLSEKEARDWISERESLPYELSEKELSAPSYKILIKVIVPHNS